MINMLLNTVYSNCSLTELGMITRVRISSSLLTETLEAHLASLPYVGARDQYPSLTPEQETKLKQLTILSLASETRVCLFPSLAPPSVLEPLTYPLLRS